VERTLSLHSLHHFLPLGGSRGCASTPPTGTPRMSLMRGTPASAPTRPSPPLACLLRGLRVSYWGLGALQG